MVEMDRVTLLYVRLLQLQQLVTIIVKCKIHTF